MPKVGSRDLSEVFSGILEVTIEGVGTCSVTSLSDGQPLAILVNRAKVQLTRKMSSVPNVEESPWTVVSFNEEEGSIVVKSA